MLLSTPMSGTHRLSFPYHGVPRKGSAFRLVFQMARKLDARVCAVVDSDLRSITPEWIDLLIRPVLFAGFRVCQSFLGAKLHDATGSDLSAMLQQVVGSVFSLMQEYAPVWQQRTGSRAAEQAKGQVHGNHGNTARRRYARIES
jgi:hypothetical protein